MIKCCTIIGFLCFADKLSSLCSLSGPELNLERNYCNVAPLVPESMKMATLQVDSSKTECDAKFPSEVIRKDMSHIMNISKCNPSLEILNQPKSPGSIKAIKTVVSTATGNLGDPIEVSDDSNDTNLNDTNQKEHITELPQTFVFNSGRCQAITNPETDKHIITNAHSVISNPTPQSYISDSKQLKKMTKSSSASLKANHPDNNLLSSSYNINYMGNDKFSLAGGADLIPLSRIDSGQAYSSQTVPSNSLTAGSTSGSLPSFSVSQTEESNCGLNPSKFVNYDDITITPTSSYALHDIKINKLHKKFKKTKDGKVKKKKDKKDKTKNKDRKDEKKIFHEIPKSPDKKLKKKREKLVSEKHKYIKLIFPLMDIDSYLHLYINPISKWIFLGNTPFPLNVNRRVYFMSSDCSLIE